MAHRTRLVRSLSPGLKKRMHGLSCFNFTTIDPDHVKDLSRLTKVGIEAFRDVPLPWASVKKRAVVKLR